MTDDAADAGGEPIPTATADDAESTTGSDSHIFDEDLRTFPWLRAAGIGLATLALQYAVIASLFLVGPATISLDSLRDQLVVYGFLVYNTHFVTVITRSVSGAFEPQSQNVVLAQTDPTIPIAVYLALPVVTLLAAGAFLAWSRERPAEGLLTEIALVTTGLSVSYLLVALLGRFAFVRQAALGNGAGVGIAKPSLFLTLFLMLLYPAVFGGLGATATVLYRRFVA